MLRLVVSLLMGLVLLLVLTSVLTGSLSASLDSWLSLPFAPYCLLLGTLAETSKLGEVREPGPIALHRGSSRIRLSGFAGTSHYERGSVMDSDFWASRILVAWDPFRVLVGWPGPDAWDWVS